jgi:hypothetical protein
LARKLRKQRITLRFKRRQQLKHNIRSALVRSVTVALVVGFGAGLVANHNSVLLQFLQRHTPQVAINVPETLVGLPVLAEIPRNHLWLWLPGSAWWLEQKLKHEYSSVHSVFFVRQVRANIVVIHVMPRIPLVTWNGKGFDRDGVLFAITPGAWQVLPQASFLPDASKPELGRWLARLDSVMPLWSQVASIKQDAYGTLELTLKTGSVVIWGPPEMGSITHKAQTLVRILDDAHHHLGGTARADLRFFDQGRIIVRPKSSH